MTHHESSSHALSALLDALRQEDNIRRVYGREPEQQPEIAQLTEDSRRIGGNSLFVAVRGVQADGHDFMAAAIENGAVAVICEELPPVNQRPPEVTFVEVHQSRRALLALAHEIYGAVTERLTLIGITGTNGKTTTAHVIYHALKELGLKAGLIGTLGAYIDGDRHSLELTTPGVTDLYELWQEMEAAGCSACVMEVSSHALAQHRVEPGCFDVGLFTNLSHDHLDYHGDVRTYALTKKRLFDGLPAEAVAIYNTDDPAGTKMVEDTSAKRLSYGVDRPADFRAEILENSLGGLRFRLGEHVIDSRLTGRFNAYNLLAAAGACTAVGAGDLEEVAAALAAVPPVPGRLERFVFDDNTMVFVDYAHTPDALENVLETLRSAKPSGALLWCVFGCGGDRDAQKRPIMGRLAERLADRVILTSDNPRTEDPAAIIEEIAAGLQQPGAVDRYPDRRAAIDYVARAATQGDVVLIAGKGHETYQVRGTQKVPLDDREEVKRCFSSHHQRSVSSN